ncbi:hypothetical protein OY497_004510, partial [Enterobacter hormaechei subsp. xiangfangensis]|nr:hypothetical protein [Enterobacter hormaechei subsp. xiangfangensis]
RNILPFKNALPTVGFFLLGIYYEIEIKPNMGINMETNKKDVKTNLVSVRITDSQLEELKKLSESGVCDRKTLASAFQYLLNQHITLKKG